MGKNVIIGGRIHNPEVGNVAVGANEVLDDTKGKKQDVINAETDAELLRLENEKQDNLTFDNTPTEDSVNPVTSGGVYAADAQLQMAIEAILLLIPSAASALNQLADKSFVNSTVAMATATFRGTYNVVTDLGLEFDATHEQIAAALLSHIATADNNDYAFVQIPVSATSTDIRVTERYKFNGMAWGYEYDLNNSGFTASQWAAINSGITALLVSKLGSLPTAEELAVALAGKQNVLTFDNVPTSGSNNPVKSGGLYELFTAIDAKMPAGASANNKLVAEDRLAAYVAAIIGALDATYNVTSTDGHVTVKVTQADGAITSVEVLTSDIASASALTTLTGRVSTNETDIANLQAAYAALTQNDVIIVNGALPSSGQQQNIIYRQPDPDHTPPQFYSDYMWNGSTWVLMGTYNNAIDAVPTAGSHNLVESGGIIEYLEENYGKYTENPEWSAVELDSEDKILGGRKKDGTRVENCDLDFQGNGFRVIQNPEWVILIEDSKGSIVFGIDNHGKTHAQLESLYREKLEKIEKYAFPEVLFDVWNTMGWNGEIGKTEYTREYLNTLYPDRIYFGAKALFDGISPSKVLSNTTRWRITGTSGVNVLNQIFNLIVKGNGYDEINGTVKLITTKNKVAIGKNVTILSLGDSITDANADFWDKTGNWTFETFAEELFIMDDIDYQKDESGEAGSIQCHTIGTRNNIERVVTYRGETINHSNDRHEGRGGFAATEYLRYPIGGLGGNEAQIKGLYDILGLRTNHADPDTIALSEVYKYARTTCWGVYNPDITEYSWNFFRSQIGCDNVSWGNATAEQKAQLASWASVYIVEHPQNPFYDKTAYNAERNSMFSWNAYYARYKNYENDGVTPLPAGEQGSWVPTHPDVRVCVPKFITVGLGANDDRFLYDAADEIKTIADIFREETGAFVIILNYGYPASQIPEYHRNAAQLYNATIEGWVKTCFERNQKLIGKCGNLASQEAAGVFYCPAFFVQGFDTSRAHKDESLNADFEYNYSWCYDDVHPGCYSHKQIGYQLYSLIMYILTL